MINLLRLGQKNGCQGFVTVGWFSGSQFEHETATVVFQLCGRNGHTKNTTVDRCFPFSPNFFRNL